MLLKEIQDSINIARKKTLKTVLGGIPQRKGINLGMFAPAWLVLVRVQIWVCLIRVLSTHSNGLWKFRYVWSSLSDW